MARHCISDSGATANEMVHTAVAKCSCPDHRCKYLPIACYIFALTAISAVNLCIAAGDSDLTPIPNRSALAGRFGAVGIVTAGAPGQIRSMGTGFMVSSCHVLAAGHVIAQAEGRIREGMTTQFVPAMGNVAVSLSDRAVRGTVVAAGKTFAPDDSAKMFDMQNAAHDWALIELERPIRNIEPFKLLHPGSALAPDTLLSAAGYTTNRQVVFLSVHENCRIRKDFDANHGHPGILIADCAVRSGMSGGPLLIDAGTQLIVAGIIVERIEVGSKVMAVAVSTRSFAGKIATVMRSSEICAAGQPFAVPATAYGRQDMPAEK
jgi:hypothetical protein